ncbi:hypothetical protein ACFLZM_06950 [Thermodesulfobacteriota bacterium]
MPIDFSIWERRDGSDRRALGEAAFAFCRAIRSRDGIISSRFYWYRTDKVVFWTEGDEGAFGAQPDAEIAKAGFALADLSREVMHCRFSEPRLGEEAYRTAGR